MPMSSVVLESRVGNLVARRGKVRDVYDFGDRLLFVATDRISAFDYILPNGVPRKGEVLTRISQFWFERLNVAHHFLTSDVTTLPLPPETDVESLTGRSMVVRRTDVVPIECVVRGYLAGSGWQEYRQHGTVCGIALPPGLQESSQLPEPIFTPATKAESGHDENITFDRMCSDVGTETSEALRTLSLNIYSQGAEYARQRGIIIADTKFEFGRLNDELILIDEVMTPDSSRFWPASEYQPGSSPPSFDKQFVRNWLLASGWDRNSSPPQLPDDVVAMTTGKYIEAYETLTGTAF
ncbi:MAG: phosphoribosylaminoimidazolesuccinocarboxamide synthase [Planctomycetaceae bacterium]